MSTETTSKAVVPVWVAKARLRLREGAKLGDVAKTMVAAEDEAAEAAEVARKAAEALAGISTKPAARPFPEPPTAVALTDDQKVALADISKVFNGVTPTTPRLLTAAEVTTLYRERETIRNVLEPLGGRDEQIKEYVRNHFDRKAEASGADPLETPRDDAGHYIVAEKGKPERLAVGGTDQAFSREYRSGTVSISGGDLLDLYESGEITREVFLSFTKEQRVFDEAKATAAILKDPNLLTVLRKITHRTGAGTSLTTRKA